MNFSLVWISRLCLQKKHTSHHLLAFISRSDLWDHQPAYFYQHRHKTNIFHFQISLKFQQYLSFMWTSFGQPAALGILLIFELESFQQLWLRGCCELWLDRILMSYLYWSVSVIFFIRNKSDNDSLIHGISRLRRSTVQSFCWIYLFQVDHWIRVHNLKGVGFGGS